MNCLFPEPHPGPVAVYNQPWSLLPLLHHLCTHTHTHTHICTLTQIKQMASSSIHMVHCKNKRVQEQRNRGEGVKETISSHKGVKIFAFLNFFTGSVPIFVPLLQAQLVLHTRVYVEQWWSHTPVDFLDRRTNCFNSRKVRQDLKRVQHEVQLLV